eukprot:TRINITY_DN39728_c0_g1_i1.p1 TRINITY_DN39728_c0_g1~~TRINITY_DN39728_c0_g1_i1.p1  ORF type:complete len:481 (+),score=52.03 TRINITY_DN39728_c0_g1_i1:44-1444(+)
MSPTHSCLTFLCIILFGHIHRLEGAAFLNRASTTSNSVQVDDVAADFFDLNIALDYNPKDGNNRWVQVPALPADQREPFPPLQNFSDSTIRDNASVLVLIAALREVRTVDALDSMFSNAKNPSRVRVGVVQQNGADDTDVLEGLCKKRGTPLTFRHEFVGKDMHRRQSHEHAWGQDRYTPDSFAACKEAHSIRVFRMDASEAAGPLFARAQQRRLLSEGSNLEDFCLQIDAHTVFAKNWDDELVKEWAQTENEYAVLTTYPTNAQQMGGSGEMPNSNNHWEMPHLCHQQMFSAGLVRNDIASAVANLQRPILGKLWAAGQSFSRCHAERDVPADPKLKQIFDGEEFGRGARLWTSGYDFYTPSRPAIATYYGSDKLGESNWNVNYRESERSEKRLKALFNGEINDGYGLGNRRTLEEYVALTGVDVLGGHVQSTSCVVRHWTPWKENSAAPYQGLKSPPLARDTES